MSSSEQNFGGEAHGLRKIRSDGSERRQKEIAEAVPFEAGAFVEAVAKEFREQRFVSAEGDDAVANVARRKHVQLFAQAAAGSAVVADGDHSAQIADNGGICPSSANLPGRKRETL